MTHSAIDGFTWQMGLALAIFSATYILIFSEVIHRTSAAILGAVVMVGAGTWGHFYTQEQAISAIDGNTLLLLLAMMILITLLKPTGGFEYLAIRIAKLAKGNSVLLLVYLSLAVSLISTVLDNVTTVLIFAPLTVLICRMVGLNPLPFLIAEALMSNIGGVATLIGDPPNLMIGSQGGIDFSTFVFHMGPIVSAVWICSVVVLVGLFWNQLGKGRRFADLDLDERKAINNPYRLKVILAALTIVIILFFIHHHFHLYPAYVALLGVAITLPFIRPNPQELFEDVEWSVLIFFAGLFSVVGGLESTGLLQLIGMQFAHLAQDPNMLLLTCLLLMWMSAVLSAVVDNIPFTVTMIPIVQSLEAYGVNITPLWWALALGAGLGGNGTHIGATANIICLSEAERCGIPEARITPWKWMKVGIPVMLVSLLVASIIMSAFFSFFNKVL